MQLEASGGEVLKARGEEGRKESKPCVKGEMRSSLRKSRAKAGAKRVGRRGAARIEIEREECHGRMAERASAVRG